MATSNPRSAPGLTAFDGVVVGVVAAAAILAAALWVGGQAASVLTGHGWASGSPTAGVEAVTVHRADPAAAWTSPMPGPAAYWSITVVSIAVLVGACGTCRTAAFPQCRPRRRG